MNPIFVSVIKYPEGTSIELKNGFGNDAFGRSVQLGHYTIARMMMRLNPSINSSTCVYKLPRPNTSHSRNQFAALNTQDPTFMASLKDFEDFLAFVKHYTHDCPRTLKDLARLKIRDSIKKPISNNLKSLDLPRGLEQYILLCDMI